MLKKELEIYTQEDERPEEGAQITAWSNGNWYEMEDYHKNDNTIFCWGCRESFDVVDYWYYTITLEELEALWRPTDAQS